MRSVRRSRVCDQRCIGAFLPCRRTCMPHTAREIAVHRVRVVSPQRSQTTSGISVLMRRRKSRGGTMSQRSIRRSDRWKVRRRGCAPGRWRSLAPQAGMASRRRIFQRRCRTATAPHDPAAGYVPHPRPRTHPTYPRAPAPSTLCSNRSPRVSPAAPHSYFLTLNLF